MFVDCFPYFNEEELLELRIHMLKDHVDAFLIVEADKTHRGEPKNFTCAQTIEKLGIPSEKIRLLQVELPSIEQDPNPWVRERGQRDALTYGMANFPDDTVFFISDCDEILDPVKLPDALRAVSENPDMIVHAPMVFLMGRADLRACEPTGVPYLWTAPYFYFGNKVKNQTLSLIRESGGVYFYKDGKIVTKEAFADPIEVTAGTCGWHFSWMGDTTKRQIKCRSFVHCFDYIPSAAAPLDSSDMQKFMENYKPDVGSTDPLGRTDHILDYYPQELLPSEVFKLDRVKAHLLPDDR